MACMTHSCPCGWDWFDNKGAGGDCPKCGNDRDIGHHYDEEGMDDPPDQIQEELVRWMTEGTDPDMSPRSDCG